MLLGIQDKDFKDSRRADFQGFSWRANLSWSPTNYSTLSLEGRDYARDPDINGNYVKDRSIQLDWEHSWTPLFSSIATARYGTNDYPGDLRKDDDTLFEATLVYSLALGGTYPAVWAGSAATQHSLALAMIKPSSLSARR